MIQITPQMRILVAVEPADFRKGIDGLARVCTEVMKRDPFSGWVFTWLINCTSERLVGTAVPDHASVPPLI